ncbi:hypothetical protein PR048_014133 [Dryococelus australis]|uniref:Uncharacterized protein n=1 Tax=Dryococelus australis TaxID=614101 RepID=A0ABQ9HDC9_9NEOP|nr:hypothetical protein PR048_014133 [Dryococelus australis]
MGGSRQTKTAVLCRSKIPEMVAQTILVRSVSQGFITHQALKAKRCSSDRGASSGTNECEEERKQFLRPQGSTNNQLWYSLASI